MARKDITRRTFSMALGASAATMLALPALHVARAQQNYPNRPIRFILPFGPGGVADITARLAGEKLGEKLGQRVVIENMPGPGGIAAGRAIATAAPDGHTLGLITNGTVVSVALYKSLPFDPIKDFKMVSALGYFDLVFATNAESPYGTLADFIKAAREQPGKLNVGSINVGGTQNLAAELFKSLARIDFQIIPYRGTPDVIVALLRNDVHLMVDFYAAMKSALTENKIRAVSTSGPGRSPFLQGVPTMSEAGVAGYDVVAWNGICVPTGTPPAVVNILNRAMREILVIPDIKARYADFGVEAKASSPEELAAKVPAEIKKWSDVIERAGIAKQ